MDGTGAMAMIISEQGVSLLASELASNPSDDINVDCWLLKR